MLHSFHTWKFTLFACNAYPDVCDVKIVLFPRTGGSCKGKKIEIHKNISI